jgi:heterodisulfide reductase subunit C
MNIDRSFMDEVARRSGQSFEGCFQCLSCAGGCPVVEAMDYNPNQIIRMMQYGMRDEVLNSRAIWVCLGCFACLSQCPNRVHVPAMMDALREMALEAGVKVPEPEILAFHREFLKQIKKRGRIYELEFMLRYKLASGALLNDMGAGLKMLTKGRFQLRPRRVRRLQEIRKIMGEKHGNAEQSRSGTA